MKKPVDGSQMALSVLMFSCIGGTEEDPKVRVEDPVGPKLLRWSDGKYAVGKLPAIHPRFRKGVERTDPGAYGFMVARIHHMDDLIREQVAAGMDQLVILGAGYDTRAYRMADQLGGAHVYEVDLPAISRDKQERVGKALGSVPSDVRYVQVDFNQQDAFDRLAESGYQASGRTLFVLSGVSMYLPEPALLKLFSRVASQPAGASIVFDYMFDGILTDPDRHPGAAEFIARATKAGEEVKYGMPREQASEVLERSGLRLTSDHNMTELAERYLRRSDGSLAATPYEFAAVAQAVVPG